jgi:hypothetical protein
MKSSNYDRNIIVTVEYYILRCFTRKSSNHIRLCYHNSSLWTQRAYLQIAAKVSKLKHLPTLTLIFTYNLVNLAEQLNVQWYSPSLIANETYSTAYQFQMFQG